MTHHIIYIPGLGDSKVTGQQLAVRTWSLWGVQPHLFQMNWADDRPFQIKFDELLKFIDELSSKGKVSLVAASAGATAAMNAYAERPQDINGVVCIAGKINYPRAIGEGYKRRAPSFWESAQLTTSSLDRLDATRRKRILSVRGMVDIIVPARDSILQGANNRMTWTSGHALTIGTQLVFGAPFFISFLKRLPKQL